MAELQGELDYESAELLQGTVGEIIADAKRGVVLDLQGIDFIDGAGLERLLWARDYCNENNCQIKLANLNDTCIKILEVTRLADEFECYNEMAEAVHSFV